MIKNDKNFHAMLVTTWKLIAYSLVMMCLWTKLFLAITLVT